MTQRRTYVDKGEDVNKIMFTILSIPGRNWGSGKIGFTLFPCKGEN
jgi:hypothetical protein